MLYTKFEYRNSRNISMDVMWSCHVFSTVIKCIYLRVFKLKQFNYFCKHEISINFRK